MANKSKAKETRKPRSTKKPKGAKPATAQARPPSEDVGLKTSEKPMGGQRFVPGGQPGPGRPKGVRNRVTKLVEEMLEGEAEAMTNKLIEKVKAGSVEAMKVAFGIMAPPRKDRLIELPLPKIETAEDLVTAHGIVIRAVAKGEISPGEAHSVAALLDFRRRAVESIHLEERMAAIEARLSESGGGHHHGQRPH